MQLVNQFSYVFLALFVLLVTALLALRWQPERGGIVAVLLVALVLAGIQLALRVQTRGVTTLSELRSHIGGGKPVLVEVYSNY